MIQGIKPASYNSSNYLLSSMYPIPECGRKVDICKAGIRDSYFDKVDKFLKMEEGELERCYSECRRNNYDKVKVMHAQEIQEARNELDKEMKKCESIYKDCENDMSNMHSYFPEML